MFSLRSNCFEISRGDGEFVFTLKGYGHGVGMSQAGSQAMALDGKSYREILFIITRERLQRKAMLPRKKETEKSGSELSPSRFNKGLYSCFIEFSIPSMVRSICPEYISRTESHDCPDSTESSI